MRAFGVDVHPRYQGVRVNDKIDEGFVISFAIQKAADGLLNYTRPFATMYEAWKAQYDSIADVPVKGFYHWYRTDYPGVSQANICLEVWDDWDYDFGAIDFER